MIHGKLKHEVKRCLVRYSPRTTTTNQETKRAVPLGHQMFFGRAWDQMGQKCQNLAKKQCGFKVDFDVDQAQ